MAAMGSDELAVTCICAEWCDTCRDYRKGFYELAERFPAARCGGMPASDLVRVPKDRHRIRAVGETRDFIDQHTCDDLVVSLGVFPVGAIHMLFSSIQTRRTSTLVGESARYSS